MNLSLNEHESSFIDAFIIRERRERYRSKIGSPKKRSQFLDRLNHRFLRDVSLQYVMETPIDVPSSSSPCYVIACEDHYDGLNIPGTEAPDVLRDAMFGILVSFVPGKLVAYKDEAPSDVVWLKRD